PYPPPRPQPAGRGERWATAGDTLASRAPGRGAAAERRARTGAGATEKRVHMQLSTGRHRCLPVEQGGIVGLAGAQQVGGDPQEGGGEDGEGLLLGTTAVEEALVADAPLWRAPCGHEGREIEGMA